MANTMDFPDLQPDDGVPIPAPRVREFPIVGSGPGPRCGHTLTAIAGPDEEWSAAKLILFGGATALEGAPRPGEGGGSAPPALPGPSGIRLAGATSDVHVFEVRSGTWERCSPAGEAPSPRAAHAAAAVGNMVVVQGGIGPAGLASGDLHVLDLTDCDQPRWHRVVVAGGGPGPRYAHSLALVANRFLVAAGGNDGRRTLDDAWALDTSEKPYQWRAIEGAGPPPPARMYAAAGARADGLLLLAGGRGADGAPLGDAHGLARHRDGRWEWAPAPGSMPVPRYQHGAAFVDARLVVLGGAVGGGRVVDAGACSVVLDTAVGAWSARAAAPAPPGGDASSPDAARGAAGSGASAGPASPSSPPGSDAVAPASADAPTAGADRAPGEAQTGGAAAADPTKDAAAPLEVDGGSPTSPVGKDGGASAAAAAGAAAGEGGGAETEGAPSTPPGPASSDPELARRCRHAMAAVGPFVFVHGGLRGGSLLGDLLVADDARGADLSDVDARSPPWGAWLRAEFGAAAADQAAAAAAAEDAAAAAAAAAAAEDAAADAMRRVGTARDLGALAGPDGMGREPARAGGLGGAAGAAAQDEALRPLGLAHGPGEGPGVPPDTLPDSLRDTALGDVDAADLVSDRLGAPPPVLPRRPLADPEAELDESLAVGGSVGVGVEGILGRRRDGFPAGRDMPTPDIRLHHRAVVVAQDPSGDLGGMVRSLSIDHFENEGRRVAVPGTEGDEYGIEGGRGASPGRLGSPGSRSDGEGGSARGAGAGSAGTPGDAGALGRGLGSPLGRDGSPPRPPVHRRVIRELLHPKTWRAPEDRAFPFSSDEICALCDAAEEIFRGESTLLRLRAPIKIFGDLHGQYGDLMRLFEEYGTPSTAGDVTYIDYLFLGDYVDRGAHSLETICLLLALKVAHPASIHLIRGNHEAGDINALFGFRLECLERMGEAGGSRAWSRLNALFDWLPLAALVEGRVLCMHGGIGRAISTLAQIEGIPRPIGMEEGGVALMDLLWSDPTSSDAVEGIQPSPRGPGLVTFGPDRVREFCRENSLQMIVRAHECVMDGFERFAQGHLITLFSATNYCGTANNAGAILVLGRDLVMVPKLIHPLPPASPRTPGSAARSFSPLTADDPPTPHPTAGDTWMAAVNEERPPTPPRGRGSGYLD